jgi:hypothetical protein
MPPQAVESSRYSTQLRGLSGKWDDEDVRPGDDLRAKASWCTFVFWSASPGGGEEDTDFFSSDASTSNARRLNVCGSFGNGTDSFALPGSRAESDFKASNDVFAGIAGKLISSFA